MIRQTHNREDISLLSSNKLILVIIFSILLLSTLFSGTSSADDPISAKDKTLIEQSNQKQYSKEISYINISEKIFRIAAYIIGAIWVYFNFFKGRTYRPRLETYINGEIVLKNKTSFIKVSLKIKNVGLSKVDIKQKGTGLRLLLYRPSESESESPWKHDQTIPILESHGWIEPGETIEEQFLFNISSYSDVDASKVEIIIVSKKTMWESVSIIT